MVVIWQKQAQNDLKNFSQNSHIYSKNKIQNYINSLIEYTNYLTFSPYLGKVFSIYKNIKIRQLLFQMHRILYYIENNEIRILSVIHTSRNINKYLKFLKSNFKNFS